MHSYVLIIIYVKHLLKSYFCAFRWGCEHEKQAQFMYNACQKAKHKGFDLKDCGLYLHPDYPHLGATPDGVVECSCCGNGVCEIKVIVRLNTL